MEKKYLFLGGLFPQNYEKEILKDSKGAVQNAANVLQWNVVKGLDENLEEPVTIMNSLYIGSFPKRYKKAYIKSFPFSHTEKAEDLNVGFCNICGYKQLSREKTLKRAVKKWIDATSEKKYIIAYAMTSVMVGTLAFAKKYCPDVTTCLIVPDLPQYMDTSGKNRPIYRFFKQIDIKKQKTKLPYIDKFVLLTDQMHEVLGINNYIVIEGMVNGVVYTEESTRKMEKTLLYTGGLNSKYGIANLVDAFMQIPDPEYRLILCGTGDAVQYIKEKSSTDKRIEFRGLVANKEVVELQRQATVLINPRQNNEVFTKYSFPSKNLEYMMSGTPVIAYKLDGIPDEYDEFLHYVKDDSIDALKNEITEVCEQTCEVRKTFGKNAQCFVMKNKSAKVQIKKILDFLE